MTRPFFIAAALLALVGAALGRKPDTTRLESMPGAKPPPLLPQRPPLPKRTIFGVGVGFDKIGATQGTVVSTVLPNSPAARAGLTVGHVVTEINGEPTVGRAGDDCARIIRECFGPVRVKFLDPALKEKTLTLDKAWLTLPD